MSGPLSGGQVQDMVHRMQADIHYHGLYVLLCNHCGREVGGAIRKPGMPEPSVGKYGICPWCRAGGDENLHYEFVPPGLSHEPGDSQASRKAAEGPPEAAVVRQGGAHAETHRNAVPDAASVLVSGVRECPALSRGDAAGDSSGDRVMTTEERTILLGHAADLESRPHGLPGVAKLIRTMLIELDSANETIAALRTPPVGTGGTE